VSVSKPRISAKQTTEINDSLQSCVVNFFETYIILPFMTILLRRNRKKKRILQKNNVSF